MSCPPLRLHRFAAAAALFAVLLVPSAAAAAPGGGSGSGSKGKDRTAPTITIAAPTAGATVSGTITVRGSAGDNAGLSKVEVSVDGGAYRAAIGTSSWSAALDTTSAANGSHTIAARATDGAGNTSQTSVIVTFSNQAADGTAPTVTIETPTSGAAVGRPISVRGTSADAGSVATVEVKLDAGAFQTATGTTSWATSLDASAAADGAHTITARSTDTAGNVSSTSVPVTIVGEQAVPAPAMAPGTLGGYVFKETDRDGVVETTDEPLSGQLVYLYRASGEYVGNRTTNADGWYAFSGLADGAYTIAMASMSWVGLREAWTPDTTGTIQPRRAVTLAGIARADLGFRPIIRSTTAPISSYTGPNGLKVHSYNDVVGAQDVYDKLVSGALVGREAQYVTVCLDRMNAGQTRTGAVETDGTYTTYGATSDVSWLGWLRGDGELFHEYGHAWSMYYAYMVHADPALRTYLEARGVFGDPRVGTSYGWDPKEMIAEDYRQLFGTPDARADMQINGELPPAEEVPGLRDFLANDFITGP